MITRYLSLFSFLIIIGLSAQNQTNSNSPYSRYGIGDISLKGFGPQIAMGGIGQGLRSSFYLNPSNAAANSAIDSLSFRFELGMSGRQTLFSSVAGNESSADINYSYLAFGFPIRKNWGMVVGLIPYSGVGYEIIKDSSYTTAWNTNQTIRNTYTGNGGIDQVFLSNGFQVGKHLSLGVNLSYLFGSLDQNRRVTFIDSTGFTDNISFTTKKSNRIVVSDFMLGFSAQMYGKLKPGLQYTLGILLEPETKVNAYNSVLTLLSNGYTTDTVEYFNDRNDMIRLPTNLGIGFSLQGEKWLAGADFYAQNWENATFLGRQDSLGNSWRFSAGLQVIPAERSISSYFNRIRYRAGFYHSQTYLNLKGEPLSDQSLSIGMGLPLWRSKSALNLSYTFGRRGTTQNNLIREDYHVFSLNLSLHDIWFIKRKFD